MKKIVSLALALVMLLSMMTMASAETELKIYLFGEAQNLQKVLDKFYAESGLDTKLNFVWNTAADHREKMPLMIGNEEPCDLVFDAFWMNLATMIKQDMYADISSYFNNDEYPGLKAAFPESYLAQVTQPDGAIYAIPFTQAPNDIQVIFYRADLQEKYGMEPIASYDDLEAYLEAVKENEKDMVAPFGVGGSRAFYYIGSDILEKKQANVFEVNGSGTAVGMEFEVAISEDGKTVLGAGTIGAPDSYYEKFPAPYNTNTRSTRAINTLTKWSQYTQPNSITEEDVPNNLFYTGLVAAEESNISAYDNAQKSIEALGGKLGVFVYNDGLRNQTEGYFVTAGQTAWNFLCVPYYSKNVDAAMKFIDWIFQSPGNHDLFELGLLGEDFELNADGDYRKLQPDNAYQFYGYEMTWNPNFVRTNDDLVEDVKSIVKYGNDPASYKSSVMDGFVFDNQASMELQTAYAAVTAIQAEYIRPFMHGSYGTETEAKLNEYWNKASAAGIDLIQTAIVEQVQAFLDAKNN